MIRTWNVEWSPISDKYVLMLWLNNKAYTLNITKEFAKTLGDAYTLEGLIEQGYINENTRLKSENAALRERLENAVELPRIIHPNKNEWFIQYQLKSGIIDYSIRYSKEAAEARLAELKGE